MLKFFVFLLANLIIIDQGYSYSAHEDAKLIRAYLDKPQPPKDHAVIARSLVHKAKWAAVGSISTNEKIEGFPMVNIMSIADGMNDEKSTGLIYFLSTTLDFTGKDLLKHNKTTFMISDDEDLHCSKQKMDPMEPTCARVHISGSVVKLDESFPDYQMGLDSVENLHPAAKNWIKAHVFSLCRLHIQNIFVLDYYGGPHLVTSKEYYMAIPNNNNDDGELSESSKTELRKYLDTFYADTETNEVNIKIPKNKYRRISIQL